MTEGRICTCDAPMMADDKPFGPCLKCSGEVHRTRYTPKWKDKEGNVLIFPARNTLFEEETAAREWQVGEMLWMIPFGLSPAGILEVKAVDGEGTIPHRPGKYGMLGNCCIIDGPHGPTAKEIAEATSLATPEPDAE